MRECRAPVARGGFYPRTVGKPRMTWLQLVADAGRRLAFRVSPPRASPDDAAREETKDGGSRLTVRNVRPHRSKRVYQILSRRDVSPCVSRCSDARNRRNLKNLFFRESPVRARHSRLRAPARPHADVSANASVTEAHFRNASTSTTARVSAARFAASRSASEQLSTMTPTTAPSVSSTQNATIEGAKSPTTTHAPRLNPQNAQLTDLTWSFCSNTRL